MKQFLMEWLGVDRVLYAFGWIPVPVFINNKPRAAGSASKFLIFTWINVKPKYFLDHGLMLHELEHCEDYYRYGLVGYELLYKFSPKWRLFFEMKAYTRQFLEYVENRPSFVADRRVFDALVVFMATGYDLDLPLDMIKARFRLTISVATGGSQPAL